MNPNATRFHAYHGTRHEGHRHRTQVTGTATRADNLRLGDTITTADMVGAIHLRIVTTLVLVGDDVIVNGDITTSRSNEILVLTSH